MTARRLALRLGEAADLLGYSSSSFRRMVAAGKLPGPIDPSLPPKLRRWSRPLLERYAAGQDRASAFEAGRPGLRVVGE